MRSNCLVWAWREQRRLERAGVAEVIWWGRRSRPVRWVCHVGIEHGGVRRSFKPLAPREHAWWELPLLLWHEGHVVEGDAPEQATPLPAGKRWASRVLAALAATYIFWSMT